MFLKNVLANDKARMVLFHPFIEFFSFIELLIPRHLLSQSATIKNASLIDMPFALWILFIDSTLKMELACCASRKGLADSSHKITRVEITPSEVLKCAKKG